MTINPCNLPVGFGLRPSTSRIGSRPGSAPLLSFLVATVLFVCPAGAQPVEEIYELACSSCHGPTGEGLSPDSPILENFPRAPADLTDPLFNSREPAADWFLVTKYGGARLGLSDQMPGYEGVYSDEQIHAIVAYLKSLADTAAYPPGDLNFTRPIRTIKPFPEDEALIISRWGEGPGESARRTLYYAQRFGARFQGEIKASQSSAVSGGDREEEVELGLKWSFYDDLDRSLLLGAGLEAEIPLESGENTVVVPYLGIAKGIGESGALQGNVRFHLPTSNTGSGDMELSVVAHRMSAWPRGFSPGLELVHRTRAFDSSASAKRERTSVIPQGLIGLTKGGHVALGLGVELPVHGFDWDYRAHAFLLWDWADGAFWRGW